jgi:Protein of unknown function (DUF3662)/FHA domain
VNPVARFERFIERLMERTFARASGSHLQPVEIGKRLVRAMESERSVGVEGAVVVPNVYDVFLSPEDWEHFMPAQRALTRELETHVARAARQRRFHMLARPAVRLDVDKRLQAGDLAVKPYTEDVRSDEEAQHTSVMPQVNGQIKTGPATPNIIWEGRSYAVLGSPTRVGRLADNDIVLNDKRVSRHHAEFLDRGGRWVLRDAGSTNGTSVNGKIVREAVLKPGDMISLGGLEVEWEQ